MIDISTGSLFKFNYKTYIQNAFFFFASHILPTKFIVLQTHIFFRTIKSTILPLDLLNSLKPYVDYRSFMIIE